MTNNNTPPELINDKDILNDEEFMEMLRHPENISRDDLLPKNKGNGLMQLNGWTINVSRTIFPNAKVEDVLEGWNMISSICFFHFLILLPYKL
jgi:hypothetical protein